MATRGSSIPNTNSLRDRQIASLKKVLTLNNPAGSSENDDPQSNGALASTAPALNADAVPIWKVLCFDSLAQDVISSVLRVSDLRALGVTFHMNITTPRHPIPDVPCIYLISPTAANLAAITADLQKGLYSPAYINFLSSIPRPLLEDFASQTAAAATSEHIAQIYDQYLNFVCEGDDLFSLGMQESNTYYALNSANTTDEQSENVIDRIVSGLFSVVVCMGVIPILRCPKGTAAELVAQKLDRKLRDHILNSKDNLFSSGNRPSSSSGTATSRPVLIILDRNVDLTPMLSHSLTYQSLVHDVLDMKLNRITIETPADEAAPGKAPTKKAYDVSANDFFWAQNAILPFPTVAEAIDSELTKYRDEAAAVTRGAGVDSIEDFDNNDTSAQAHHLKNAVMTLLPELRERKAILDTHMAVLGAVMAGIQNRGIHKYFELEETISKQTKPQMLALIKDPLGNSPVDKLRLFIIWFLTSTPDQDVTKAEWTQFRDALVEAGVNTSSLPYIQRIRAVTKMSQLATSSTAQPAPSASSDIFHRFSDISSRITERLKESGVSTSTLSANLNFMSYIKSSNRDLTVTQIVESIMDPSIASSSAMAKTENYLYFDPRSANARGTMPPASAALRVPGGLPSSSSSGGGGGGGGGGSGTAHAPAPGSGATFGQRRQGYAEAVVFTVGGGSIDEYGNLQEWVQRTAGGSDRAKKRVVYGSTELTNADEFIKRQLEALGSEIAS